MNKKERIKINNVVCDACGGSGVYVGFAEKDGVGVVCSRCGGTGKKSIDIAYEVFEKKKILKNITHIVETNPGIGIGGENFENFGGMSYKDWLAEKPFPQYSEMRKYTCPAWWYQCANYDLKPDWDWCLCMGSFSSCNHFKSKGKCWERFDNERGVKK